MVYGYPKGVRGNRRSNRGVLTVILQHSPINVETLVNIETSYQLVVVIPGKRLREYVGDVVSRGDLLEKDGPGLHEVPNIVVSNVDMLDLPVVLRVLRQRNPSPVVPLYYSW